VDLPDKESPMSRSDESFFSCASDDAHIGAQKKEIEDDVDYLQQVIR
jgi:hypothetical protein